MKKNTHPFKQKTVVILQNGSSFLKSWMFFKKNFKTEIDYYKNFIWLQKINKK